jgi:hypothetical protein
MYLCRWQKTFLQAHVENPAVFVTFQGIYCNNIEYFSWLYRGRIRDVIGTKVLRVFLLAIHSHRSLVRNVNIVYENLKSENSQDYAQKNLDEIVRSWIRIQVADDWICTLPNFIILCQPFANISNGKPATTPDWPMHSVLQKVLKYNVTKKRPGNCYI